MQESVDDQSRVVMYETADGVVVLRDTENPDAWIRMRRSTLAKSDTV